MKSPSLRMYVDENGSSTLRGDLSNNSNRFLCLTGVIMQISTHERLTQALDELKEKYFGSPDIILHRREIIPAAHPFESLKDPVVRDGFNADLLAVIEDTKFGALSVLIDKKHLVDKYGQIRAYDPYSLALEYLMQRYQYWMQEFCQKRGHCFGDILAESRGGHEDKITKETHRLIYEGKGYNQLKNADHFYSSKEIKLKKKRDNIAGLQFVDLISHPCRRYILSKNGLASGLKAGSFEQSIVDILVAKKFRKSDKGIIESYGTVIFP